MPEFASRGSQRWLQLAVKRHPEVLQEALRRPLGLTATAAIEWRSPIRASEFREYRHGAALALVDQKLTRRPLRDFWPAGGPVWDALGLASDGSPVFVEAKAHIAEAASPGTQASPDSLLLITASLNEARKFYAPKASADRSATLTCPTRVDGRYGLSSGRPVELP